MRRIVVVGALGLALGGCARPLRIMPLGDSITAAGCWRGLLEQKLAEGRRPFDFVGGRTSGAPACAVAPRDPDHEGHGGYLVSDLLKTASTGRPPGADPADPYRASAADLAWLEGRPADVVLMHFGTNDLWNDVAPETILAGYAAILQRLRAANPRVRLLVAQLIPLDPSGCPDCPARVRRLNALIPAWAAAHATAASPIEVVDHFTGFDVASDTRDRVHPNQRGAAKIAARWFQALAGLP